MGLLSKRPSVANVGRTLLVQWSAGLALGVVSGLLPLVLGTIGLGLALPGLVWSLLAGPRGVAASGFMVGLGSTWLIVWARASQACVMSTASEGCSGPDLTGWSVVPIAILVVGGLIGVASASQHRR